MHGGSRGLCAPSIWLYFTLLGLWYLPNDRAVFVLGYRVARDDGGGSAGELVAGHKADGDQLAAPTPTNEPSCEQLKAMWRFSKRQSRAAETTNEIPTYRDPFRYNVWEPFGEDRSRSMGGMRLLGKYRKPVFGRLIHNAPAMRAADLAERNRAFDEMTRMYGSGTSAATAVLAHQQPQQQLPRRRVAFFRVAGGGERLMYPPIPSQQGSFQHLKELIRTERVKELQEQRMAEEAAARAASIMQANEHQRHGNARYSYDSAANSDDQDNVFVQQQHQQQQHAQPHPGIVTFPDLLAPSTSRGHGPETFVEYGAPYALYHHPQVNFFEPSLYNDLDGLIL